MRSTLAVILGGGQGTRLFPLTEKRAKPAVPIGGKFRLIDIPISNCLHWGIKKIYVLTQFNTESLHRHITGTYKFDGFSKGFVQVMAAQQTIENKNWYQGTADAVRKNLDYIRSHSADQVVVLSGDQLFRINLGEFLQQHRESGAEITIATKPVSRESVSRFGIMQVSAQQRITAFAEKPKDQAVIDSMRMPGGVVPGNQQGEDFLASMGIYIFDRKTLVKLLEENDSEDFGKGIIPASIHRHKVHAYVFSGYWEDIGTIRSFFDANLDFANPVPRFNFYDEVNPIFTHARFLPGSKVRNCHMHNALISDGSIIEGSRVEQSIVGIRSIIKEGSHLDHVIMMGSDVYESTDSKATVPLGIGKNCFIRRTILDKNVRIGDHVNIDYRGDESRRDAGIYHIVDGIVVIPKNAVIPAGTTIT